MSITGLAGADDWREGLLRGERGGVLKNLFNACVVLRDHPALAGRLAYDEFHDNPYVRGALPWDDRADRPWSEFDDLAATEFCQSPDVAVHVGTAIVREATQRVAYERRFHPVLDYLEGLAWDGQRRLHRWLATYFGASRTPIVSAFGRKFLIGAVARIYRPGCQVDHVLLLEGPQGAQKSRTLRALVGHDGWFADQVADLGGKDSAQDLRGVWIVELSELSAMRRSDLEKVKAFISRQVDHYRPTYGRRPIDVPRQCTFVGTTNESVPLNDATGNRRFWPVTIGEIDYEAVVRDREQLWAEAVSCYLQGAKWWVDKDRLQRQAEAEQEVRRLEDPWETIIEGWLEEEGDEVTIAEILSRAIRRPAEHLTMIDQKRVARVLQRLGWTKRHTVAGNVWDRPG